MDTEDVFGPPAPEQSHGKIEPVNELVCPKCDRHDFKNAGGLAIHLSRTHKVAGKAPKAPKKSQSPVTPKNLPRPSEQKLQAGEPILERGMLHPSGTLEMIFPDGIPYHKIKSAISWLESTRELLS